MHRLMFWKERVCVVVRSGRLNGWPGYLWVQTQSLIFLIFLALRGCDFFLFSEEMCMRVGTLFRML